MNTRKIARGFVSLFFVFTMLVCRAAEQMDAGVIAGSGNLITDSSLTLYQMALYPFKTVLTIVLKTIFG